MLGLSHSSFQLYCHPVGWEKREASEGAERLFSLLLLCVSSHLNTDQSISYSLETTSTHSQCLQLECFLFFFLFWFQKWAIVRQELTTWMLSVCVHVWLSMLVNPGDCWLSLLAWPPAWLNIHCLRSAWGLMTVTLTFTLLQWWQLLISPVAFCQNLPMCTLGNFRYIWSHFRYLEPN